MLAENEPKDNERNKIQRRKRVENNKIARDSGR